MRGVGILALFGLVSVWSAPSAAAPPKGPEASTPSLRVEATEPEEGDWRDHFSCPLRVVAEGFPAISADGSQVMTAEVEWGSGEGDDTRHPVDTLDVATEAIVDTTLLYDLMRVSNARPKAKADPCVAAQQKARRRVRRINKRLREEKWRPMKRLEVRVPDQELDEEEPDAHPFEAFWRKNQLIVRRKGVKVYLRADAPWGNPYSRRHPLLDPDREDANICEYEPVLEALYGDATTGVLAVSYDYDKPETSCICTSDLTYGIVHADAALFADLD